MQHDVQDITVNQFTRSLRALKVIIGKARETAKERKFDENVWLETRLAPDMFPLVRQIQFVTDNAKGTVARLTGKTAPVFPDTETSFDQLLTRIDATIEFMQSATKEEFKDYSTKKIVFPWNKTMSLKGDDYLGSFVNPNFYFHMSMAYALFRLHGVPLGKADFLGELNWNKEA